jgi:hypothetical protein
MRRNGGAETIAYIIVIMPDLALFQISADGSEIPGGRDHGKYGIRILTQMPPIRRPSQQEKTYASRWAS